MEHPPPFFGISGVESRRQAEEVLSAMPKGIDYKIMIGVRMNETTLSGRPQPSFRLPDLSEIQHIFPEDERAFNVIHFSNHSPEMLLPNIRAIVSNGGPNLHGIQLNCIWPGITLLRVARKMFPKVQIILQIGVAAMKDAYYSNKELAKKLEEQYGDLIDYVMIDPSSGCGRHLDLAVAEKQLEAISLQCSSLGLGIAGGFGPENLSRARNLFLKFPKLSLSAETSMRSLGDKFDTERAKYFVKQASELLVHRN